MYEQRFSIENRFKNERDKYLKNQKKYEIFLKSKRQFRKEWTDKLRLDF